MQFAVIGAGLTGCLSALELADRGHSVCLYEAAEEPLTRASLANEGKIHLGYVYAADATFDTARRLIDDAVEFRPVLERWINSAQFDTLVTEPFTYYVLNDSMIAADAIEAHLQTVDAYLAYVVATRGAGYLGFEQRPIERVEVEDPDTHTAAFRTQERALWPSGVASALRKSLLQHPRIELRMQAVVQKVDARGEQWSVVLEEGTGAPEGPFDGLINAAWADRRRIDAASGYPNTGEWITRYKFGLLLSDASRAFDELPCNSTAVLGAYGDSVYYPQVDVHYSCWYPVGMCFRTTGPIDAQRRPQLGPKLDLAEQTWRGLATQDSRFSGIAHDVDPDKLTIVGDYIIAKGRSDILDPNSRLHQRQDHGPIRLADGYWSVETGKYSSAAPCAIQCVDAVLGSI